MIDSYIYIIDDLIFFCTGLLLLYLFVMAVASHFKHITYPKAQKTYRCAILVPEGSLLPEIYKEESYEFITYSESGNQQFRPGALRSGSLSVPYSLCFISAISGQNIQCIRCRYTSHPATYGNRKPQRFP